MLIDLPDAHIRYQPKWVDAQRADHWLQQLSQQTPWTQPQIKLYGRSIAVPRLVAWYGDTGAAYRYSGLVHDPLPWTPLLTDIRKRVEQEIGEPLNGVLLNFYRNGQIGRAHV